ncbi:alpha/beta-hydrolase [Panaeolus papilionaceus]|nr:alpha/beta-hydrolase [Panaeolus papilionaceus]
MTSGSAARSIDYETYTIKDGLKVVERFFNLPLDYSRPDGEKIRVFARHAIPMSKAKTQEDEAKLPVIVYLQGGPGFESRPPSNSGFAKELHEQGYQILWLDQRGTGLSTPVLPDTLPSNVKTDEEIAQYLKFFRADSIVKDCEQIRHILLRDKESPEDQKWSLIGQSFGGFCVVTYLSLFPHGLKEVFITGGLPPLVDQPDTVYDALARRVIQRNKIYYEKYPLDIKRVRNIVAYLESNKITLPSGGFLTVGRFQQLGISLGMHGGIDNLHQIIFRASNDLELFKKISYKTLQQIEQAQSFDGNPIYAILHEPCYLQGQPSNWSAARVLQNYSEYIWDRVKRQPDTEPYYFVGEMMYPGMFEDYANLRPWKGAAEILAKDADWPRLYDTEQLAKNEVKVNAITYYTDMYVDFDFAQRTAARIKNIEQYITNQLFHNGVTKDPVDVMKNLFKLSKREYD